MKVRIRQTPTESEMDGVKLDALAPGTVRDVSPSIGSWLIAEGYAEPEMRNYAGNARPMAMADDRGRPRIDRRRQKKP